MSIRSIFAAVAFVLAAAAAAQAGTPRVFLDSKLVMAPRFSDEIVGKGPDLIFISGMSSSRETWAGVAKALKDHYRVHLIELAGYAGEPARDNGHGLVIIPSTKEIAAYLVSQHLTPATVIGHSLGGTIALILAEAYPQELKKVMLVDVLPYWGILYGGPNATPRSMIGMANAARKATHKVTATPKLLARMATAPADRKMINSWIEASNDSTAMNSWADDVTIDLRPGLKKINVPVTLVYPDYAPIGETEQTIDARYRNAYKDLKGIKFVKIKNAVHFVMLDQPAAFMQALEDFLKE